MPEQISDKGKEFMRHFQAGAKAEANVNAFAATATSASSTSTEVTPVQMAGIMIKEFPKHRKYVL